MKLSGKSLEQFEKWYLTYFTDEDLWEHNKKLTDSEKYGVLVDFFDSVGIEIFVKGFINDAFNRKEYYFIITDSLMCHLDNYIHSRQKSRPQARTKAIEKANDLYNKR